MASFPDTEWQPEYAEEDKKENTRLIGIEFESEPLRLDKWPEDDEKFKFLNEEWLAVNEEEYWTGPDEEYNEEYDEYYDAEDEEGYTKYGRKMQYIRNKLKEAGIVFGGIDYDGGGKEIVTMPDSFTLFEQGGSKRLKDLVEMLSKYTKADTASGTHIHVSKLENDTPKTWDNIYWFCMCFGPQLQKLFGRVSGWAPVPLPKNYFTMNSDYMVHTFEAPQKRPVAPRPNADKHRMVNDRGNRYEFRAPKATHDLEEVLAWVELCHNIVEVCANGYIKDIPFSEVLKGKYIRKYAYKIGEENPKRALSSEERGKRISDIGYVKVDTHVTTFSEEE